MMHKSTLTIGNADPLSISPLANTFLQGTGNSVDGATLSSFTNILVEAKLTVKALS